MLSFKEEEEKWITLEIGSKKFLKIQISIVQYFIRKTL
jgi:hypothetical protein